MSNYIFTKDGSRYRPRKVLQSTFDADPYGTKYDVELSDPGFYRKVYYQPPALALDEYKNQMRALKNTINYYFGTDPNFNFDAIYGQPVSILSLPSYHLGSGIRKGSVKLTVNRNGTLLDYISDKRENGILYSNNNDAKIGFVLYKEGFIFITSGASLVSVPGMTMTDGDGTVYTVNNYRWFFYGAKTSIDDSLTNEHFMGTINEFSTSLTFVYAEKGELNHSNNPSYLKQNSYRSNYNSRLFIENEDLSNGDTQKLEIKNTVSSSFNDTSAQFEKQTFITSIGLFDKDKKLIAVSNLANPIRKNTNREFLFKLKLDI
jgi:hypothetical protein